jgi:hypothetical protein
MDPQTLVVQSSEWWGKQRNRINQLLEDAAANGIEFTAAGWLQTIDDGQPYLYLVSDWSEKGRLHEAYTILHAIQNSKKNEITRRFDIKFVSPSTLLGRGLIRAAHKQIDEEELFIKGDLYGVELIGPALIFSAPSKSVATTGN